MNFHLFWVHWFPFKISWLLRSDFGHSMRFCVQVSWVLHLWHSPSSPSFWTLVVMISVDCWRESFIAWGFRFPCSSSWLFAVFMPQFAFILSCMTLNPFLIYLYYFFSLTLSCSFLLLVMSISISSIAYLFTNIQFFVSILRIFHHACTANRYQLFPPSFNLLPLLPR